MCRELNDIVINISRQSIIVESWVCFNLIILSANMDNEYLLDDIAHFLLN